MFIMKLTDLLSSIPYYVYKGTDDLCTMEIKTIEMDHRKIKQGDLFICLRGFTVDGHDFAEQAVANGASAIVAERDVNVSVPTIIVQDTARSLAMLATHFFDFPSHHLPLIGITGTNGKTTISYLLENIFKQYNKKTALIGTIQMKIGDEAFPLNNTTPDALFLQKTFKQMVDEKVEMAIMEVSSHALDLGRVRGTEYDIAVFTNLTQDHLDYHNDMDDYLRAKSLLFAQLGNSYSQHQNKFAIVNEDDPHCKLIKKSTAQHVITYGCKNISDVMATNIKLNEMQTCFILKTPVGNIRITSKLIGMFNVYNMLAASSAAIAEKVPLSIIKKAFENITGIDGRFESIVEGQDYAVIVDYAHTPDSLKNVLATIIEFAREKVYVVVGCGGDRDRTKRPLMAEVALKYADQAIFTSDNPRTEEPSSILKEMTVGLKQSHYEIIVDRKQAIEHAIRLANGNDIILIAGKGHESYQEIDQVKYHFDDREVAREAIKNKGIR